MACISNKICMNLFMFIISIARWYIHFLSTTPGQFHSQFHFRDVLLHPQRCKSRPTITSLSNKGCWFAAVFWVSFVSIGMYLNIDSDRILRNLRPPGSSEYKIPRGGMFEYVSQANFFGEIVEWTGFALMCGNIVAAMFVVNTCLNVVPRALQTHQWYFKSSKLSSVSQGCFLTCCDGST